jgi:methylglyoxal synthase
MKIAIIAHDRKKADMVQFLFGFKEYLDDIELVATGTTGSQVEAAGLQVQKLLSEPLSRWIC